MNHIIKLFYSGIFPVNLLMNDLFSKKNKSFTPEEIKKHNNLDKGVWVTYKGDVYNVTNFVNSHPGGNEKLMQAAGGPVEPYWNIYQQHYNQEVIDILKPYKIGTIKGFTETEELIDPYKNDPERDEILDVKKNKPFNAEPPLNKLIENYITPNNLWFVRNHHPVPIVEPDKFTLKISSHDNNKELTLDEIKKLPSHTVISTIVCAGNRRKEFSKPVQGLMWNAGAVSTAEWKGVKLKDLIQATSETKHVHLIGIDCPYDASIPIQKALDSDTIVAYEMNGEEIPNDHGYPLRIIVPGVVGARNVKWLKEIKLSDEESYSSWQRGVAYKGFSPNVEDFNNVDPSKIDSIQCLPVTSAICKTEKIDNKLKVSGYAWSGCGRGIVRVDVSKDNGKTWLSAKILNKYEYGKAWAWTLWELEIEKPEKEMEIICRAVDDSYNIQPENKEYLWNLRGILNNSWHKEKIIN
jgi:sulfite oxidase